MSEKPSEIEIIERMLLPSKDAYGSAAFFVGQTRSGKTYLMTKMVDDAMKLPQFKNTRFIYFSLKNESYWPQAKPTNNMEALFKSLQKEQLGVYYPTNPDSYEYELDAIQEHLFALVGQNPDISWTLLLDDINVLKGFTNQGRPSASSVKTAITGAGIGIKPVYIVHRLGNLPKLLNSSINAGVAFRMPPMDEDYAKKQLGVSLADYYKPLAEKEYSWSFIDVHTADIFLFNPI